MAANLNYLYISRVKEALYRIWCGGNRLGDSGVRRLVDTSAFVNPAGQLLLTRRGKTRMDGVGIVFEFLYSTSLSTGICVSALVFSWLNKMFPSTTTIHLYYYQCRWHTVDINGVRRRQSALNEVN